MMKDQDRAPIVEALKAHEKEDSTFFREALRAGAFVMDARE
jgi:hypothetical protein